MRGNGNMRIRKIGAAALASGLAMTGLVALTGETAGAAKIPLQGTLSCTSAGSTAIIPGLVLTSAQLPQPKMKDKKPKYITTGSGSACSGTTTSGTAPSSYTLSSKAKGLSRLIVNPNADCNAPGRAAKTKITLNQGSKIKVTMVSEVGNYAYNTATQVSTPFPPCGSSPAVATAFAGAHANDRIETRSQGVIASNSKAYAGKVVKTRSRTTETLAGQLSLSLTPGGVTLLHADSAISTLTVGL
jgi:hypothetical protein